MFLLQINAPFERAVVFIDPIQWLPFTKSNRSWSRRHLLRYPTPNPLSCILFLPHVNISTLLSFHPIVKLNQSILSYIMSYPLVVKYGL